MRPTSKIFVLDDDDGVRRTLRHFLESKEFTVVESSRLESSLELVLSERPDVAILDYMLPDGTALELLGSLKTAEPDLPVIILTGHGTIDLAVRAIKEGAEHFLTKPVELAALAVVVDRALHQSRARHKQLANQRSLQTRPDPFLGSSTAIRQLRESAEKLVDAPYPVLILGETGAGKGVLARWLHDNGPRCAEAFVDLNCSSLSKELLESELFGHEKGAFTGAVSAKKGLVEVAHRGTLFLDEIADMATDVQPRLLTVLEDHRFRRLGEIRERSVNIRLIAATHQDMANLVHENRFRADLYYRINALPLKIPPLRERGRDIALLARRILDDLTLERGGPDMRLADSALARLESYCWPGNIRELRNVLERAVLLADGDLLQVGDFHFDDRFMAAPPASSDQTLKDVERAHIERILTEERGRVAIAAKRLGVPRSTLYQKIKDFDLTTSET